MCPLSQPSLVSTVWIAHSVVLQRRLSVTPEVGSTPVPGYRLTQPLGQGAFGTVWEAVKEDGSKAAFKFLDCRARSSSMISGEVRVLRALSELKHPHIIPLYGVHAVGKYLILAMERADSNLSDLRAAYRQQSGLNIPPEHALELLEQAAIALDFIAGLKMSQFPSSGGLQHCDIKPTNLLLVGNKLKVADFGLCAGAGWQTHSDGWKGTLPYAAPELFKGAAKTGTDQFALAITFCELVIGERAFWPMDGSWPTGIPIDLTKLREKEFPVIARALHPYPSARWPSCRIFVQELRKAVEKPRGGASVRIFPRGLQGSLREAALTP